MNGIRCRTAGAVRAGMIAAALLWTATEADAQGTTAAPLRVATLVEDGRIIDPGDLLRTTRIFPNWNLNCEVLLSQGRHLCAVELRSVDAQGRQVFAWSIALAKDGNPLIIFKVPSDLDQSYGLRMVIGAFTTILNPRQEDCGPSECRLVAPFETALRTLMVAQQKIGFSLKRGGVILQVEAPLAGLSEALDMARRDPIGLLATQHAQAASTAARAVTKPKRLKAAVQKAEMTLRHARLY
jgi:Invasion associated locus B (IalB) protein